MKTLEDIFGISTDNKELFQHALTHPSYAYENELKPYEHYERLEFLGDAVLKFTISDILFRRYPDYAEGELSKIRSVIVSDNMLAKISDELGLADLILLAKHEEKQGVKKLESVKACSFEALLGAYHLDGKLNELLQFIERVFVPHIDDINYNPQKYNAKAVLQEYTQGRTKETPVYTTVSTEGPEHNKTFNIEVQYQGEVVGHGHGKTKKEAEQMAALEACDKLGVLECKKQ